MNHLRTVSEPAPTFLSWLSCIIHLINLHKEALVASSKIMKSVMKDVEGHANFHQWESW
jgi:hypothetical protein